MTEVLRPGLAVQIRSFSALHPELNCGNCLWFRPEPIPADVFAAIQKLPSPLAEQANKDIYGTCQAVAIVAIYDDVDADGNPKWKDLGLTENNMGRFSSWQCITTRDDHPLDPDPRHYWLFSPRVSIFPPSKCK